MKQSIMGGLPVSRHSASCLFLQHLQVITYHPRVFRLSTLDSRLSTLVWLSTLDSGLSTIMKETAIKGPPGRWKFDVRRVWECPVCRRKERTGGHVVSRLCDCQVQLPAAEQKWMQLVESPPVARATIPVAAEPAPLQSAPSLETGAPESASAPLESAASLESIPPEPASLEPHPPPADTLP